MDEPVNADMEPEDALRVLLGEEHREDGEPSEPPEGVAEPTTEVE